jgi:hypothetical protein
LVIALALLSLCAFAADEAGQPASRFHAKTTTGNQFDNASIKGKVVLFEFWTTGASTASGSGGRHLPAT